MSFKFATARSTVPKDLTIYTDETVAVLNQVINSIDYDLDITEQSKVDEYVNSINEAVSSLKKLPWYILLFRAIVAFFRSLLATFNPWRPYEH